MQAPGLNVTLTPVSSRVLTSLIFLGLAACTTAEGGNRARPSVIAEPQSPSDVWKGVATDADEQRIARTGLAWQEALQEARRASPREVEAVAIGTRKFQDRCVAFCATDHPLLQKGTVTMADVVQEAWAMGHPGATTRLQFERRVHEAGFPSPTVMLQTDSVEVIIAVVAGSSILGWLPEPILQARPPQTAITALDWKVQDVVVAPVSTLPDELDTGDEPEDAEAQPTSS